MLPIILMMSCHVSANELQNISKTDAGYLISEDQLIKLANYISELESSNLRLKAQLEQAEKELERTYMKGNDILRRVGDGLTGAGLAALIVLIAQALR